VEILLNFLAIGLPDLLGETIIGLIARAVSGRWVSILIADRPRAEAAVHRLSRAHIGCWLRSTGQGTNEVMVRSKREDAAMEVLRPR
jgi:hypothetical protein